MECKKCHATIDNDSSFCKFCGKKLSSPAEPKAKRRANGNGSIIKLGGRRRNPYAVRITVGFVDGVQQFRYIGYYRTKTEAEVALAKELISPSVPKADITFSQLYEEWLETARYKQLSKQTQDNYSAAYQRFTKLYNVKFTDIRTAHLQKIIDETPLSHSSKSKMRILCGLLYKYAMETDICDKNYATFIRLSKEEKKPKQIFPDSEIQILWENRPETDPILVLIYTGFRLQEMLFIQKTNVDIKNMVIIGGLKTDAGKDRIVPIHPKIQPIIKELYDNATGRLFYKGENEPISPNYFRTHYYYPLLEKLGIERKSPHSTRHTFATMLSNVGADPNDIKALLGHTDYAFTANIYTHPDTEKLRRAVNFL